ncbi:MAG: imidazoleglycerol-phosphate dehydratase HisB [Candidatus Gastranaerophilales bacterium]|nr:imidazoleglycerol-phosphate dehydratase HisB [Candidatus Gastranaerophilales bacterium]
MREATVIRQTLETEVKITLNLDGTGKKNISTPFKFFNHMLEQIAVHGYFDLDIELKSLDGDSHHGIEDTAIALGDAFKKALGDKKGINRYGNFFIPMDEALVLTSLDFSGRAFSNTDLNIKDEKVSDFETILIKHFFSSFASAAAATLHIKAFYGEDTHHIIEAAFKSFARALAQACEINQKYKDIMPSSKGIL